MAKTPKQSDLDALIADIGVAGAQHDGVMADLAKGAQDAISLASSAIALLKGKGYPMAKGGDMDEGDDDEPDMDEEGGDAEDEDGDDDSAGYEDLLKGQDGDIDATEFLLKVGDDVNALRAGFRILAKGQRENNELLSTLLGLTAAGVEANAKGTATLAKGVMGLRDAVATIPEPSLYAGRRPRVTQARRFDTSDDDTATGTFIGGSEATEKVQLAKARMAGIINNNQLRAYNLHGEFSDNKADHDRIRKQVEAL
jgi:hypothetical protein